MKKAFAMSFKRDGKEQGRCILAMSIQDAYNKAFAWMAKQGGNACGFAVVKA